jgi:hypothetical protein
MSFMGPSLVYLPLFIIRIISHNLFLVPLHSDDFRKTGLLMGIF